MTDNTDRDGRRSPSEIDDWLTSKLPLKDARILQAMMHATGLDWDDYVLAAWPFMVRDVQRWHDHALEGTAQTLEEAQRRYAERMADEPALWVTDVLAGVAATGDVGAAS